MLLKPGRYTIVTFGDSITAPREDKDPGRKLRVYSDVLRDELPKFGITGLVINQGIGGNNTRDALARFERDVLDLNPDLVIFMYGMNDSALDLWKDPPVTVPRVPLPEFIANLTHMVRALKTRNVKIILVTPNPRRWGAEYVKLYGKPPYDTADPMGFNYLHSDYAQAVRDVAAKERVALADIYNLFWSRPDIDALLSDGVHLNDAGQQLVAEAILKAMELP